MLACLFFSLQVLTDAGDRTGAYEAAKALVEAATPSNSPLARVAASSADGTGVGGEADPNLDLVSARMICSQEDCSGRSLDLFASIASRSKTKQRVRLWSAAVLSCMHCTLGLNLNVQYPNDVASVVG